MGMSLGGYSSQLVALQRASLTLVASERLGWDGPASPHISETIPDHFGTLDSNGWSDTDAAAEFLLQTERLCAGSGAPFDERRMKRRVEEILKELGGRFRDVSHPVLAIHGEDDPVLPFENGEAIAAGVPGANLLRLRGAGHELPPTQWATIADRVAVHVHAAC